MTNNPTIDNKPANNTDESDTDATNTKKKTDSNTKYHPLLQQMLKNTEETTTNTQIPETSSSLTIPNQEKEQEEEKEEREVDDANFIMSTEYKVNPTYYSVVNNIYSSAIRTELIFVIIGAQGLLITIIAQTIQGTGGTILYNVIYGLSVIFFLLVAISIIFFAMDSYYRKFTMIKYKFVIEKNGIAVFPLESSPDGEPVSFVPYTIIQDVEKVRLGRYLLQPRGINITLRRITKSEIAGVEGVLVKYRLDKHFEKYPERKQELIQKSLFFQAPPGSTLYIVDEATTFMKSIKKAKRTIKK